MLGCAGSIDFHDAGVRMRASKHASMQHARQLEVQSVLDAAAHPK
jgi:hypothetical protein